MDTASHSLVLLQQLNMQREFGFLCDCTVAIGDVYFKAHRAVLAAFSNYFKMIFIHQTRLQVTHLEVVKELEAAGCLCCSLDSLSQS
uniref:Zinc finger and BTB domain containing 25 n=1 Tax=Aotus nancymaae TaxID=37293 RepID=A0A2K5CXL7_AOTNA